MPALLIRLINDPAIGKYDLSSLKVIQSGGQRMQPEVRLKTREPHPERVRAGELRHVGRDDLFVRRDDPEEVKLETCGRPISPDDEVRLVDDEGREIPDGEVGELTCRGPYTLRGYYGVPEYNAKQFTPDGFYCSGDLMRQASLRQLRRRGTEEGPHQPRRREDQRRGDREPDPLAPGGAERRLRAGARPEPRREDVCLCRSEEKPPPGEFRNWSSSSRARRSPSSSCRSECSSSTISRFHLRQGVQEGAVRDGPEKCASLTCTAIPARRSGSRARDPTSRR